MSIVLIPHQGETTLQNQSKCIGGFLLNGIATIVTMNIVGCSMPWNIAL